MSMRLGLWVSHTPRIILRHMVPNYGAVPDHDHGLRWPGDPDGSLLSYLGMGVQEPTPAWGSDAPGWC